VPVAERVPLDGLAKLAKDVVGSAAAKRRGRREELLLKIVRNRPKYRFRRKVRDVVRYQINDEMAYATDFLGRPALQGCRAAVWQA
jgi:hypothetical protein